MKQNNNTNNVTSIRRKLRFFQKVAVVMAFLMIYQIAFPVVAWALTSGPTQPEVQGFEPVGTTQMVDLFSGDFNYNIPLFDLPGPDGGYPFNLAYHAGVTMDQEASWVGLGWTLNAGAMTRSMRGVPDEFNGDEVTVTQDMRTNTTWSVGASMGKKLEFFGHEVLNEAITSTEDSDFPGTDQLANVLTPSLGFNVVHNTYRGWSMGVSPTMSFSTVKGFSSNMGLSFNGQDGTALSFGMGVPVSGKEHLLGVNAQFKAGVGFSSAGIGLSQSGTFGSTGLFGFGRKSRHGSINTNYTYAAPAFTPEISLPWNNFNLSGNVTIGPDPLPGSSLEGTFSVSYSQQKLKSAFKNEPVSINAYGYLNLDNSTDPEDMLDFNREKDGTIYPQTPNLATPILTNDVYSVVGQGIGTMYRPVRSDIGIIGNRQVVSDGYGGGFGVEFGAGSDVKIGGDIDVNYSRSESGRWNPNVGGIDNLDFKNENSAVNNNPGNQSLADYEKYYFQAANEMIAESPNDYNNIGGDEPVRLKLADRNNELITNPINSENFEYSSLKMYENASGEGEFEQRDGYTTPLTLSTNKQKRRAKTSTIQPITNKELLNGSENEELGAFDIKYYDQSDIGTYGTPSEDLGANEFARNKEYNHHIAGFTATQPGGVRYIYGLPVYNTVQEDYVFSVDGTNENCGPSIHIKTDANNENIDYKVPDTEQYYKKTEMPPYVHAHLLTSILGNDYIDVNNNGPDDADYGYWVKLNYVKTTDGNDKYKWRTPFLDANYVQGVRTSPKDDKGNFSYGEREQYYLATAETKTHIAKFIISEREDALGASQRFQGTDPLNMNDNFNPNLAAKSYQLDQIKIFSKLEITEQGANALPIKTVHFKYKSSGELCRNIPNHVSRSTQNGKLTLEEVYFTYGENNRGALSPYKFDYIKEGTSSSQEIYQNPYYNLRQYDKWGMYKPNNGAVEEICDNQYMPYVNQFDNGSSSTFKDDMDRNAAVWSLKHIHLPSGASINIDYETDDYGYEQNRVATQMFEVKGVETYLNDMIPSGEVSDSALPKVYFEVDNTHSLTTKSDVAKYLEDLYEDEAGEQQLYFKIMIDLKNGTAQEFVEGYAMISDYGIDVPNKPYVVLKRTKLGNKYYHPFSAAAWQQLRVMLPDQIYTDNGLDDPDGQINKKIVKDMAGKFGAIFNVFRSYYGYCVNNNFGRKLDLSRSFIKLNNPDKKKLGGGIRVRQVSINDNWQDVPNEEQTVGQVFEYTTVDELGNEISSGVLTKEPMIGGEESALRYAKVYPQGTFLKTHNNFFFEGPTNESYFPGPSVGYSKVTVKSLATHYAMNQGQAGTPSLPSGFATTGVTVNEFYTAKDFPVITDETEVDGRKRNIILPIPFMNFHDERFTGSQGYSIELNDMHGKPHRTTHYALDDQGQVIQNFVSQSIYKYYDEEADYQGETIRKLVNKVPVLKRDNHEDGVDIDNNMQLGVDYEFFTDLRKTYSLRTSFGGGINNNQIWFIPAVTFFPRASYYYNQVKTAVTNKIIRKKGILHSVEVYDESSKVVTQNKLFDPLTGAALLTSVHNEYDDEVFNYSIPARWIYDGMDAAYKNIGMKFTSNGINVTPVNGLFEFTNLNTKYDVGSVVDDYLVPGDEFIVSRTTSVDDPYVPEGTATFVKKKDGQYLFDLGNSTVAAGGILELHLIRSGRRNHIGATVASITSKSDPTQNRVAKNVIATIDAPKDHNDNYNYHSETIKTYEYGVNHEDILSASAVVYRDNWALADIENLTYQTASSGYSTGEQGIWRPYKSYAYLTDLKAGADADHVSLKDDGTYADFVMFSWESPFFDQANGHGWKLMNEATLFNKNGHGLESRDALGHYSAALYGYNGNLSTAVAGNARYQEIAFDGFEEYATGSINSEVYSGSTSSHLDIVSPSITSVSQDVSETQSIISGFEKIGTDIFVIVNKENFTGIKTPDEVTLSVTDKSGNRHIARLPVKTNGMSATQLPRHYNWYYNSPSMIVLELEDTDDLLPSNTIFTGQATLHYSQNTSANGQGNSGVAVVNTRAHTGKNSIHIPNGSLPATFNQNYLNLQQGKKYIFSAWVSEENIKQPKFKSAEIIVNGAILRPTGRIIDGWQRVEGEFTATSSPATIQFNWLSTNSTNAGMYVDDIRIFPKDGAIQTYVYDRTNYRLMATLDANNYATFYTYDSEGSLTIVRKETKEGVVTVQEARSHIKNTAGN